MIIMMVGRTGCGCAACALHSGRSMYVTCGKGKSKLAS